MATERITDRMVRNLAPGGHGTDTRTRIVYDTEVTGFGVRITKAGSKSFVLRYVVQGHGERRLTIGQYPTWSVAAAREEARDLRRLIDRGDDPLAKRNKMRTDPTVNDLCDLYVDRHLPRKRPLSQRDDKAMLDTIVRPRLGKLKVNAVRHGDVERLHADLSKAAPIRANRVAALVSKLFALAVRWEYRGDNPARGIERNPENKRQRYLSGLEIARLSAALAAHPEQQSANAVRLLMLTGARRMEVLAAQWDQFDLAAGVWIKPGATTKQKSEHRVPLSAAARQLLSEMKAKAKSDYLFPGLTNDEHQKDIKRFWASVSAIAEIKDCRLHDLRHTYASVLASAGLSLPIIGALLGHTQPGTTARYAHLYDDPLRAATERVGAVIANGN